MMRGLAQNSFSTRDTESPTRKMESMKLNTPLGKVEKDGQYFENIHCMYSDF